jgi:hypothetical protein
LGAAVDQTRESCSVRHLFLPQRTGTVIFMFRNLRQLQPILMQVVLILFVSKVKLNDKVKTSLKKLWPKSNKRILELVPVLKSCMGIICFAFLRLAIFVAVECVPGTLPSWDLVKQQHGPPVGAGDPMHSSCHQSIKEQVPLYDMGLYKFGIIRYPTYKQCCGVLVRDILVRIRIRGSVLLT